jgi:hypothetical protein
MFKEAIKDLTKAAELGNVFGKDHDVFHQRGLIHVRLVPTLHAPLLVPALLVWDDNLFALRFSLRYASE